MKITLKAVVLLLCMASSNYGMSDPEGAIGPESIGNPMLMGFMGTQLSYTTKNGNLLPLPYLPTQEGRADNWLELHQPPSSSAGKVVKQQDSADKSQLEQLSAEIFQHIIGFLCPITKQLLARASRTCRAQTYATIKAISISVDNITQENLKDAHCSYPQVRTVFVYECGGTITPAHVKLLADAFPHTTSLDLRLIPMTVEIVDALAQPGIFVHLKSLNLGGSKVGDEGIKALAKASFAPHLEFLNLEDTGIKANGLAALATPGIFIALKKLDLSHNSAIGDTGLKALLEASFAKQLKKLSLRNTSLTAEGTAALFQSNKLVALKSLILAQNSAIRDEGLAHLSTAPFTHTLELLNLESTGITVVGIKALTQPNTFTELKSLILYDNFIGNAGIEVLVQAPFAQRIEYLNLSDNAITTEALEALAQPGVFTNLKVLNLSHNSAIGNTGIKMLLAAPFAGKLEWLDLDWTGVTKTGAQQLLTSGIAKQIKIKSLG